MKTKYLALYIKDTKTHYEEFLTKSEAIQFERDIGYFGNSYAIGVIRKRNNIPVWINKFINQDFVINTIESFIKSHKI